MVFSHDFSAGKLEVQHPWARPTAPVVKTGAVYLVINNPTQQTQRLLSARVPQSVAEQAQIHQTLHTENMLKMREAQNGLLLPAKETTELTPGGSHIMLVGLKQPLVKGAKFPMQLQFENSPEVTVEVWVEVPPEANSDTSNHSHH